MIRLRTFVLTLCTVVAAMSSASTAHAQFLLLPMDDVQRNHLKAYGVTFQALKNSQKAEWLLNYRGGAFLLPDTPELRRRAALDGIAVEGIDGGAVRAYRGGGMRRRDS